MAELDELEEFRRAVAARPSEAAYLRVGLLHCPKCGGPRKMDLVLKYREPAFKQEAPILGLLICGECDTEFTAVLYKGPEGSALAVDLIPSFRTNVSMIFANVIGPLFL